MRAQAAGTLGGCAYRPRAHLVVADSLDFGQAGLNLLNCIMNHGDGSRGEKNVKNTHSEARVGLWA
jgi:hypothetical protein